MKRPLWSGAITFGLINIPVRLYKATKERQLSFKYLRAQDLCPIKYVRICKNNNQEVDYKEIVKGYEYHKGDFVIVSEEDFKRADAKKTQTIEVMEFVKGDEINHKYLEKPYYIEPDEKAARAYAIFREALKKTKKVALAKYVMRTKEYLTLIIPENNYLVLNQIRYQDEIVSPSEIGMPEEILKANYSEKELDIAIKLIDQLSVTFQPENYHDTYTEKLKEVIEEKHRGKVQEIKEEPVVPTEVADIMSKLKESLKQAESERRKVRK